MIRFGDLKADEGVLLKDVVLYENAQEDTDERDTGDFVCNRCLDGFEEDSARVYLTRYDCPDCDEKERVYHEGCFLALYGRDVLFNLLKTGDKRLRKFLETFYEDQHYFTDLSVFVWDESDFLFLRYNFDTGKLIEYDSLDELKKDLFYLNKRAKLLFE